MSKYVVVKECVGEFPDKLYARINDVGEVHWHGIKSMATKLTERNAIEFVNVFEKFTCNHVLIYKTLAEEFYTIQDVESEENIRYLKSQFIFKDKSSLYNNSEFVWTTFYDDALKLDYETAEKYTNIIKVTFDINADIVRTDLDVLT